MKYFRERVNISINLITVKRNNKSVQRKFTKKLLVIIVLIFISSGLLSQDYVNRTPEFTGYFSLRYESLNNRKAVPLIFNPNVLIPAGKKLLIESEFELEIGLAKDGQVPWNSALRKEFNFLQVDYLAHENLTAVTGRFLIPFGICSEHSRSLWYKKLQVNPYTFDFHRHSGNGFMFKGKAGLTNYLYLSYAAYYTFKTKAEKDRISELFESEKSFGGRASFYIPLYRLEFGGSFIQTYHLDEATTGVGINLTKRFREFYTDFRAEYINFGNSGSSYWIEAAHRFSYVRFLESFFERSQIVARWEQFFPKNEMEESMSIYSQKMSRLFIGYIFYMLPNLKFSAGYGITIMPGMKEGSGNFGLSWKL